MSENYEWWITTDFFADGGKVYDNWGPFPSRELALRVRALVEGLTINRSLSRTFAVDRRIRALTTKAMVMGTGPAPTLPPPPKKPKP